MVMAIQRYFRENLDDEIGELGAELVLVIGKGLCPQCHTHRRRNTDRRSTADHQVGNRLDDLFGPGEGQIDLFAGQDPLIQHDNPVVGPFNRLDHAGLLLGKSALLTGC